MTTSLTSGGVLRIGVALIVVVALLGGGLALYLAGSHKANANTEEHSEPSEQAKIPVKTIKPHFDKDFFMLEKRPADVLPYYRDDLDSRVAGVINMIEVASGYVAKKDETLIDIYVPELEAQVKVEEAALERAKSQVVQKKAAVEVANAEEEAVKAKIEALGAKLKSDQAYFAFRGKQARRYAALLTDRAIDEKLVDEQEDRLEGSREAVLATKENINAEKAHLKSAIARIDQANADVEEAKSKVEFQKAEVEHAKALKDFATIKAPFDGVIVERNSRANVGAIVQRADSGNPKPLLVIQRQDIVTVVINVPDNFAPYLTPKTEAIFETATLPGIKIHGRVTRFPPSLINPKRDRTMTVEVDLWNGTEEEYDKKMKDKTFLKGLKKGLPDDPNEGRPIMPKFKGAKIKDGKLSSGQQMKLLPGMFGQMTLVLRSFSDAYMIPSSAVVTPGGYTYIYVVKDGKAHMQPVKVQIDDGRLAKVERLNKDGEVIGDLTGDEEIIVSNQGQLSEGQVINPSPVEDWKAQLPGEKKDMQQNEKKDKH